MSRLAPAQRSAPAMRSLWLDQVPDRPGPAPLDGDTDADVAIVGAGFTGLWIAYYLTEFDPGLRVLVIDAEHAGFGASGRNGGWCTGEMPALLSTLIRAHGPMPAMRMYRAALRTLGEIDRVLRAEGIDAGWQHDGSLYVARTGPQLARLHAWQDMRAQLGIGDLELMGPDEARRRLDMTGVLGAGFTPHCAAVHPGLLVHGLAGVARRRGVRIAERTRALRVAPGRLTTDRGTVRAQRIIWATEAYTGRIGGHARRVLPVYSHLLATAPLDEAVWQRIGWRDRMTVAESRYHFAYLQRTADDRLVIGGSGNTYHFGSGTGERFDRRPRAWQRLRRELAALFPGLPEVEVSHTWGGAYGLHRDTQPSVQFSPSTGLGVAGGYGGEGIVLSNLAGRTMAALITGTHRPETRLCWTGRTVRAWEPEPLRFAGVRTVAAIAARADRHEDRTGRRSGLAALAMRVVV